MSEEKTCMNCGAPVREINYALGPQLMHIDPNSSFPTQGKGSAWRYCKTAVATLEPKSEDGKES